MEQHFGACRQVYNMGLEIKVAAYRAGVKTPSAFELCKQLPELKEENVWMKALDSQALQAAVKKVDVSYKNFFKGACFPKFQNKHGRQSYQCPHEVKRIDWEKQTLTIPKIKDIPIVLSRKFEGKIKTITISREPSGKYYASILVETVSERKSKPPVTPETSVGIDLGVKHLVTLSTGEKIDNPRFLQHSGDRLRVLQQRLGKKKKGSSNYKKAKYKVVLCHEKVRNQRKDYLHKISFRLVRESQAIMMEDLNVKGMSSRVKPKKAESAGYAPNGQAAKSGLNKSIRDAGMSMLVTMIEYKADWYGTTIIKIPRFAPSSKLCSNCKTKNVNLKLSDRDWVCEVCGATHDRDENAAVNIKKIGYEQYCKNNSGKPLPEEPVEMSALAGSVKQEIPLY